tara:strand:+ start:1832 stop:2242 length:411 start_codon:yes stop_codon:yes gene_type:complete
MIKNHFNLFPFGAFMFSHLPPLNFLALERHSEDINDYADQHNPALLVELSKRLNAQADRLEFLFMDIVTSPDHQEIEYKDIMHWKARATYLRNVGQAKAAAALEKAEALKEAKAADDDEEFQEGYKEFLANEFDLS